MSPRLFRRAGQSERFSLSGSRHHHEQSRVRRRRRRGRHVRVLRRRDARRRGYDVVVVERKDAEEAGHIACGDALKGASDFPEAIPKSQLEPAFTNTDVDHGRFEIPQEDAVLEIPVPGELAVIDRWEYGRRVIDGAESKGTDFHYDTVVQDVEQDDDGQVTGITAMRKGREATYEADLVVDAAGALSLLQDKTDFEGSTFDTNVRYSQFCSAYREIIEVEEPVEWDDALVFKPTERSAGYLWYFPRTSTEINAGLGFQMNEEPMELVDDLKADLEDRPEFRGAEVTDKLGAALPTRRPYDSAVAPGYIAVGDAAGHVNPTTGGGIAGRPTPGSTPPSRPSRPSRTTPPATRRRSGNTT
ncbi:geranylgeranyl reductase family protein [Halomicroarcula sp. GCM10025710]